MGRRSPWAGVQARLLGQQSASRCVFQVFPWVPESMVKHQQSVQSSGSPPDIILPLSRRHLAMSGDIFYCDNRCVCVGVLCMGMGREGTISNQCVEARGWLNILQCITQFPKNELPSWKCQQCSCWEALPYSCILRRRESFPSISKQEFVIPEIESRICMSKPHKSTLSSLLTFGCGS